MRLGAGMWTLVLAVGLLPGSTRGQSVLVRVSDGSTATPLQGVMVSLSDGTGTQCWTRRE